MTPEELEKKWGAIFGAMKSSLGANVLCISDVGADYVSFPVVNPNDRGPRS